MIQVIINPAAGQDTAVLATINSIFQPAGIEWAVSITQKAGDAKRLAEEAAAKGVEMIAVYGGDGTVAEVAGGLTGSDIPLAIFPGGTANVVAQELGIPTQLAEACKLAADAQAQRRKVDVGSVNEQYFLLRVGMGAEAKITEGADREAKNRLGFLAYVWSAAQSLASIETATYTVILDGEERQVEGVTCAVINSGNLGVGNLQIASNVRMDDGLLDIIVVKSANLPALVELFNSISGLSDEAISKDMPEWESVQSHLYHWQGKEVEIRSDPIQTIQYDGELLEAQSIRCFIQAGALTVVTPN